MLNVLQVDISAYFFVANWNFTCLIEVFVIVPCDKPTSRYWTKEIVFMFILGKAWGESGANGSASHSLLLVC